MQTISKNMPEESQFKKSCTFTYFITKVPLLLGLLKQNNLNIERYFYFFKLNIQYQKSFSFSVSGVKKQIS